MNQKREKGRRGDHKPPRQSRLLSEEDREEHDTFDERCKNDRERQDVTGSARVAAGRFSGFGAEKTDADSGGEGGGGNVKVTGDFSEHGWHHDVVVLWVR